MANRSRKIPVTFYLSEDEYDLLVRKTELAGLKSRSEYLRKMILTGIVYSIDYSEIHRNNWLLSNLTNNLNQIAHQANSVGYANSDDLAEAKKILEEVWQLQRSTLSKLQFKSQ